jgi:hypothetical protein
MSVNRTACHQNESDLLFSPNSALSTPISAGVYPVAKNHRKGSGSHHELNNTCGFYPVAKNHFNGLPVGSSKVWRRGWDSNPRNRCQFTCSPGTPIRPLSHLSGPLEFAKVGILSRTQMSGKASERGLANECGRRNLIQR